MRMLGMDTAPKDGTRILVKHYTLGYSTKSRRYERTGTAVSECWRHLSGNKFRWGFWCGNKHTTSTGTVDPIGWWPKELLETVSDDQAR